MTNREWSTRFIGQILYEANERKVPMHKCVETARRHFPTEIKRLMRRQLHLYNEGSRNPYA